MKLYYFDQELSVLIFSMISKIIAEEERKGIDRAEYGAGIIKNLAKELTAEYDVLSSAGGKR